MYVYLHVYLDAFHLCVLTRVACKYTCRRFMYVFLHVFHGCILTCVPCMYTRMFLCMYTHIFLVSILQTAHIWANTGVVETVGLL